jgi:predicted ATPase
VRHYRIGGLLVESSLELQGAIPATPDRAADVVVRTGRVPTELPDATAQGPNWVATADTFLLSVPKVARYLIVAGRAVDVELEPDADAADAQVYLLGTAFGILQHQRGRMVLHASAIAVGEKAALFSGPSGAGKSTLAAALNRRGYPCVSDDVCGIDFGSGAPVVMPDGRMLKLWSDTVSHLAMGERQGPAIRRRTDKYYIEPESTAVDRDLPVAAVYVLRVAGPDQKPGVGRLGAADAALLLRRNAYRPRIIKEIGLEAAYLRWSSDLQRRAGVFSLTRPFDLAAMPEVIGWLEDHWRGLGILPVAA